MEYVNIRRDIASLKAGNDVDLADLRTRLAQLPASPMKDVHLVALKDAIQQKLAVPRFLDDELEREAGVYSEVREIEKKVALLHELFLDLSFLLTTQEETINVIENHISRTRNHQVQANKELVQAEKQQKKSRKGMLALLLIATGVATTGVVASSI